MVREGGRGGKGELSYAGRGEGRGGKGELSGAGRGREWW